MESNFSFLNLDDCSEEDSKFLTELLAQNNNKTCKVPSNPTNPTNPSSETNNNTPAAASAAAAAATPPANGSLVNGNEKYNGAGAEAPPPPVSAHGNAGNAAGGLLNDPQRVRE